MKKIFTSALILLTLLAMTTGAVFAQEVTPVTGTVQAIEVQTDEVTGEVNVIVTLVDDMGATQSVVLSLENAKTLGLITTDPVTGEAAVNMDAIATEVSIDPGMIIPSPEEPVEEEAQHPVGSALGDFFGELVGVDYDVIMGSHEDGFGFGVIAQALWLTNQVEGDTETFTALLEAKRSGDYSGITLADGSTPDNWGDVVKSLKQGENLGSVISGKADTEQEDSSLQAQFGVGNENSNNPNRDNGNGNGNNGQGNSQNNKDKDKDEDKNNGNGNGNGNNNGHGNNP